MASKKDVTYSDIEIAAEHLQTAGQTPSPELIANLLHLPSDCQDLVRKYLTEWEIKQKTQELEESLALVRATLESTFDGILVVNSAGKIVDCNNKFVELWRIPQELLETRDDYKTFAHVLDQVQDPETFANEVAQMRVDNQLKGVLSEIEFKDGRVYERYSQPHIVGNQVQGRVWSFRDVTEKKQIENELCLRSRAIESSTQGIVIVDIKDPLQPIIYCNPAFEKITGYSFAELKGKNCRFLQKNDLEQAGIKKIRLAIQEQREETVELRNYHKDGSLFWNELRIAPISNTKGEINHYVGIISDITQRKKQEQELQLALERANLAAKAKNDFLAIMSHELRNTIGNIVSALQLAMVDTKEEIVNTNYLTIAEKTAKNILPFLENVSSYFELEGGLIYSKKTAANIVETIRAVVKNHALVKKEAVNLLLDISNDLPEKILVDNYNLYRVLDIIIYNAIRFTQEGFITIKAYLATDNYLIVIVDDTGIGISDAQLKNLFNAFPISQEQNAKYGKFGLRLSIAKKMLQLIGGDITVQSKERVGTKVIIKLPFEVLNEMQVNDSETQSIKLDFLSILVVEDDPISLEIEAALLARLDHKVDAVSTGIEAINQVKKKRYDLIFMDITLPDISGIEAANAIHEQYPSIPIVAVTSHSSEETIDELLSQGMLAVISKPVSLIAFKEFFANYNRLIKGEDD